MWLGTDCGLKHTETHSHLGLQLLDLDLVFAKHCVTRVLVDHRLVFHLLHAGGEAKSRDAVLNADLGGREVGHHGRARVAAKRVLQ